MICKIIVFYCVCVPTEGYRSICMEGGVSHSGSTVVNPLPGVSGRTTNSNCEL